MHPRARQLGGPERSGVVIGMIVDPIYDSNDVILIADSDTEYCRKTSVEKFPFGRSRTMLDSRSRIGYAPPDPARRACNAKAANTPNKNTPNTTPMTRNMNI